MYFRRMQRIRRTAHQRRVHEAQRQVQAAAAREQLCPQSGAGLLAELALGFKGEREVEVVAAEDEMLAYRGAEKLALRTAASHFDESEVRGASANVADKDKRALGQRVGTVGGTAFKPRVERCLRFLEQAQPGQAGLPGGFQRQRACAFVEGGGDGQNHLLLFQRRLRETV